MNPGSLLTVRAARRVSFHATAPPVRPDTPIARSQPLTPEITAPPRGGRHAPASPNESILAACAHTFRTRSPNGVARYIRRGTNPESSLTFSASDVISPLASIR